MVTVETKPMTHIKERVREFLNNRDEYALAIDYRRLEAALIAGVEQSVGPGI